ncbi:hypothetical protein AVEN_104824-1 [Araneus ventricosus]|uniref:Uncharacterized protein n=1 Tax=Araneus ventricosus TaxID=182803 RepID=A0A4Y2PZB0_ARAVE|nr:hypothetical protein AVEN_104824-1 [Araneus ventricosus]
MYIKRPHQTAVRGMEKLSVNKFVFLISVFQRKKLIKGFFFKVRSDAAGQDRVAGAQYSPLATISVHGENDAEGPSPTLSWPVASTSGGRRHTLDTSPTPLVGSVISLCSSSSEGGARSPPQPRRGGSLGPPIRMISAESSDDASVTVIPAEDIVIEEVQTSNEDQLSVCDVQLEEDGIDDNGLLWYVEEESESTNGLLRNYPELRSQPGLDTVSWTASDDFSSTTVSGTLSGNDPAPAPEMVQGPSSMSQSSSLRMLEDVEEDVMLEDVEEDVLVVDPNDQKAVLVIGTRRCSGMPVTGDDNIGHCVSKPKDQC